MEIRKITEEELPKAMELVWEVFQQFEAPEYSSEGVQTFKDFIDSQDTNPSLEVYGAYEGDSLLGVIATRNEGSHVALFFVRQIYHRQGVGKKLFEYAAKLCGSDTITVNSSPYAVPIYRRLGFVDQDVEQLKDGIRYTPMKYTKQVD